MSEQARFCAGCATPLGGAAFCTNCGTPAGQAPTLASSPSSPVAVGDPATESRARTLAMLCILAGAGMAVGSFLPWIKVTAPFVGTVTKSGIEGGDGWFSVIAGGVVAFCGLTVLNRQQSGAAKGVVILAALVAGILCVYEYSDISSRFADVRSQLDSSGSVFGVSASDMVATAYGAGLHLIAGSAVLAFIVGLQLPSTPPEPLS